MSVPFANKWMCFALIPKRWNRGFGYEGTKWCCYFWCSGLTHISLGIHIDWYNPNIEIHIPLGFIRIGIRCEWRDRNPWGKP